MNILFLDIDGVLNRCDGSGLNTDKVALLKEISVATDCRIVLSSSWRLNPRQLDRVQRMCSDNELNYLGRTPIGDLDVGGKIYLRPRWKEIAQWVGNSGTCGNDEFVILDDEADMGPLSHLHVRTDSHTGLTPEMAREVISRFTTPKP